ncbi:N-fatty-acyl-amino acid synthase/hydrolase pm20d1.1 [Plakobranchus ocellatus]|uniref:N-fatty-acyl-amino acid synthase/hydrolase pm20d1.1 n=1 Tax=Plakobranchus ocellatus TaxID=259542 RepID=A0AAV4CBY3_9GAST|nr:N-fatty-acyl-amino acid synthase/hydrolase pm20d1.1 [Plakobranchus ocellatus]
MIISVTTVYGSVLLILAVIMVIRTVHLSRRPPPTTECKETDSDFIPLTDIRLHHFQEAIKFETISRESDDLNVEDIYNFGEYIIASFPNIHHNSSIVTWERVNNYSLLYHIQGSDPALQPYLLMAHMDVVPVTNLDKWDAPPFSGEIKDGFIYGRGTIDDKQNVMGILEATEFLLSRNIQPNRSFYIAFGHDEEVKGTNGAGHLARRLREKGVEKLNFIVDEGMPVLEGILDGVAVPVASVGVSEKGQLILKLSVEMPPGHSSIPPKESSIGILAQAVQRLEENPHPSMLGYGIETDMLEQLVPEMSYWRRLIISNIWLFRYPLSWIMSRKPTTNAVVRTVTAVTMFNAGVKLNVIPPLAEAVVNHRIHPSQTCQEVIDYDRSVINDDRVKIEVLTAMEPHPTSNYGDLDFGYQVLKTSVKQLWPKATVVPAILVGNTDTIFYLNFTKNVYRFSPTHMFPGDPERFHGLNERISLKNYAQVINFFYHLIRNSDKAGSTSICALKPTQDEPAERTGSYLWLPVGLGLCETERMGSCLWLPVGLGLCETERMGSYLWLPVGLGLCETERMGSYFWLPVGLGLSKT